MGEYRKYQPTEYASPEKLRANSRWKERLEQGFVYAGAESISLLQRSSAERKADEEQGVTTNVDELQDAGFEMNLADAFLNGDPTTGQVIDDKMAIFIRPHDFVRDDEAWELYREMCAKQEVTPIERPAAKP